MKLYAKEIIKILLSKRKVTQKGLVETLSANTAKKYTQDGFSRKINRGTVSFNEMVDVIDVLGYEIIIEDKNK